MGGLDRPWLRSSELLCRVLRAGRVRKARGSYELVNRICRRDSHGTSFLLDSLDVLHSMALACYAHLPINCIAATTPIAFLRSCREVGVTASLI